MNAVAIIHKIESCGVALAVHGGALKLRGEQAAVNAILSLVRENKDAIIRELAGVSVVPPDDWQCPSGYARHREYWTSAYGLKICTICHPGPCKGGSTWKQ